jgi:hypothetical protein
LGKAAAELPHSKWLARNIMRDFVDPCSKSTGFSRNTRIEALLALKFWMAFFEEGADSLAAVFGMKALHLQLDFVVEGFH